MSSFSAWVRQARLSKGLTQTECARRSGMKLQQWNEIERHVKEPRRATVLLVAKGLEVSEETALAGAGYLGKDGEEEEVAPSTKELEYYSRRVPVDKRKLYWKLVRQNADVVSNALATD